jgi:hypothetical protein
MVPFAGVGAAAARHCQLLLSAGAFVATVFLLWTPFLVTDGPASYLARSRTLQINVLRCP